ncbi:hypothetical protein HPB49_004411 [Dermacentor silvarum]|uniref:Uncharacterized protein n=1 Tax=Dermacentor silvarum TaxID=543639 RepID=A0ACB8DIE4_DERSI|nr:hypothetical protein HPB49_004411 [Dermacentor silvarum]
MYPSPLAPTFGNLYFSKLGRDLAERLEGTTTRHFGESQEEREYVTVSQWTDNIYKSTEPVHKLTAVGAGKTLTIEKENLPDTVVWNPWAKMAAELEDLGSEEYLYMLCVEPGHVARPVRLEPSQRFHAACTFTASNE